MVLISTMLMLIKLLGDRGVSGPEVMFWRQAFAVPLLLAWLGATGGLGKLRTARMGSHAGRAMAGTLGLFCSVTSAMLLPLAEATTLGFSTPLFAVLITAVVLRKRVGPWRWTAVALGFIGVLIIADPGHEAVSPLGVAAGLAASLVISIVTFQIRDLARTEEPVSCVFWFAVYGAIIMGVLMPMYYQPHNLEEWGLLLALGGTGTMSQLLVTASLRYGQVATVVAMDYTALIWSTMYGWLFWDLLPTSAAWLGAPAIVAAGMIIMWREHKLYKASTPPLAHEN